MSVFLTLTLLLRRIAESIGTSIFSEVLMVFLCVFHHLVHKVNAYQPSSVVDFVFLHDPFLLFSLLRCFSNLGPYFGHTFSEVLAA